MHAGVTSEQRKRERETKGPRGGVEDGKRRVMGNINKASRNSSRRKKVRMWMDGFQLKGEHLSEERQPETREQL